MLRSRKGQSTLEYSVIIGVVVASLLAMQTYIKRGIQGKLRDAADDIGEQYSPGFAGGSITKVSGYTAVEAVAENTGETQNTISRQTESKTGSETVAPLAKEWYPGDPTSTEDLNSPSTGGGRIIRNIQSDTSSRRGSQTIRGVSSSGGGGST